VLQSSQAIINRFHYEIVSRPDNRESSLPGDQRLEALRLPAHIAPRVRALVESWKTGHAGPEEIIEAARRYFRHEHFVYTLQPGAYAGAGDLEEFLFERRQGFCEHYAAAFATLMRVAGLPSRVVIGYHGGELNRLGNYVIVRQSDAHAWAEVWLPDSGWLRVDPTEVIAPDRISSGLASYLQTRGEGGEQTSPTDSDTAIGWRDLMREVSLGWDSLNYQWELRVLNFDQDDQHAFFAQLGLDERWPEIAGWTIALTLALLGALSLWLRRPGRVPRDDASGAWADFCRKLAAAGVPRMPWEGPLHFGERAAGVLENHRAAILGVADLYARLRYAATPPHPRELRLAVRALPDLRMERK
jgi:hypothetical protein